MGLAIETLEKYLIENKRRNIKQVICYAKKFGDVLVTGDARDIAAMSDNKRRHVMAALAAFSKATGCYPAWKSIIERHQLKWGGAGGDAYCITLVQNMVDNKQQADEMLKWLQETCNALPAPYANALATIALTGLRPTENYQCLKLIKSDYDNYVREKKGVFVVEHYRFASTFLRRTKKAYLTIALPQTMELLKATEPVSWAALRSAINKRGLETRTKWCRKLNATILRQAGLDSELVDLLQGRVEPSVFNLFYNRAGLDYGKIRKALYHLNQLIAPLVKTS